MLLAAHHRDPGPWDMFGTDTAQCRRRATQSVVKHCATDTLYDHVCVLIYGQCPGKQAMSIYANVQPQECVHSPNWLANVCSDLLPACPPH